MTTVPTTTRPATTPPASTPTADPGRTLFDSAIATRGLSAYASVHNAHRISVVDDPVRGSARKVMKFTVHESDNQLTGNPRAQAETAKQFDDGDDIYIGFSMMFPSDYPSTLPAGGWMTFAEVYGPPYAGGAPIRIGAQNGSTAPAMILGNGAAVPWRMASLQRNVWYDFVLRERLSFSASTGFVELWVNSGSGWTKQLLSGRDRLPLATLGTANGGGANYHKIAAYRKAGMFPVVTHYFADHCISTSFAGAAPRSH